MPARHAKVEALPIPPLSILEAQLKGTGDRAISTTMAFVRILATLLKDANIGRQIVPIVPDESRTFGMEGLFRQVGIHSHVGQLYTPQDAGTLSYYKESVDGQIMQEGLNESGATSSWIAASTSYANHGVMTIPFYIFYSMFGFQRVGDLLWAAGDARARGFLLGATSGRTTLMGEGLQHDDGHSHVMSATVPCCVSYDPTYAYELAVIVHRGMQRMYVEQEDVYYYITVLNENYPHPDLPEGAQAGILKGLYRLPVEREVRGDCHVQLMGSGAILPEVLAAAVILERDYAVSSEVWSATSLTEVRREAQAVERWNLLNPLAESKVPYLRQVLDGHPGPVVVATDYMKIHADQIRPWLADRRFVALGTDGFGQSDTREALRRHFEVDRQFIVLAALKALADDGVIERERVAKALHELQIDPAKVDPARV
ncbi:Pyruvate dehydrogenase E1 component [compost metagenome]